MRIVLRIGELRMQIEVLFKLLLEREVPDMRSGILTLSFYGIMQTEILPQL